MQITKMKKRVLHNINKRCRKNIAGYIKFERKPSLVYYIKDHFRLPTVQSDKSGPY